MKIALILIGIILLAITVFIDASQHSSRDYFYIETKAICSPNAEGVLCEDYYFVYHDNDAPIKLRTGWEAQHSENWKDPRGASQ